MAVVAQSLWRLYSNPPAIEWLVLAVLTLLTGSFTVKLPSLPAKLSVSEAFVFASALLFGPSAGTVTVVLDALVISFWMKSVRTSTGAVTSTILGVAGAAEETGRAAAAVLAAASALSRQSGHLSAEVDRFLGTVRAA